jgi:hypothetical protein
MDVAAERETRAVMRAGVDVSVVDADATDRAGGRRIGEDRHHRLAQE